jgi:hypothetical protein
MCDKCELVVQAKEIACNNLFEKCELKRPYRRPTCVCELNIKVDVAGLNLQWVMVR